MTLTRTQVILGLVWLTVAVAGALEVVVGYMIRDNLTLNVLILLWPVQSILDWQAGK
jgi:type IV secretory pathway VirB3-like protein